MNLAGHGRVSPFVSSKYEPPFISEIILLEGFVQEAFGSDLPPALIKIVLATILLYTQQTWFI